jgi:hypothetical protein
MTLAPETPVPLDSADDLRIETFDSLDPANG